MPAEPEEPQLSAQVVLSEVESAAAVAAYFSHAGFEPGPMVGTSFAISARRSTFEATFPGAGAELGPEAAPTELPLAALPPGVAQAIEAVATTGPPDFGPTDH